MTSTLCIDLKQPFFISQLAAAKIGSDLGTLKILTIPYFFCWSNSANAFCQIWQINIVAAFPAIAKLAPLRIFSIESKNLSFCSILLITLEMQKTRQLSLCNTLHNTIIYPYLLSLSSSKKNMNINLRQKNVFRLYSLC